MYEISEKELGKGRKLAIGAIAAPLALTALPAVITFVLLLLAAISSSTAVIVLFIGIVVTAIGLLAGLIVSGVLLQRRSAWTKETRERIAADGIRANELEWFRHEIKSSEKRALKAIETRDLLLGDAYRDTLASRLTATRIIRSSKRELLLAKRRQSSLKQLKSLRSEEFQAEIAKDLSKFEQINEEAKLMQAEAESRLQMIEAAASRQGGLADSELALKKLSARTAELPLALEAAKMSEEIRLELEREMSGAMTDLANEANETTKPSERMN